MSGSGELAISVGNSGYYLGSVPYQIISDFELVDENPFSSISMRVCGVAFGELTAEQIALLDYFIENYTLEE